MLKDIMARLPKPDSQVSLTINGAAGVLESYTRRAWSSDEDRRAGKPPMMEWHQMTRRQFFRQAGKICGRRFSRRSTVQIVSPDRRMGNTTVRRYEPAERGITFENGDIVTVQPPANSLWTDLGRWFNAVAVEKLVNLALLVALLTAVFGPVFATGWYFGAAGFGFWNVLLVGAVLAGFLILVVTAVTAAVPLVAALKFWEGFGRAWSGH